MKLFNHKRLAIGGTLTLLRHRGTWFTRLRRIFSR